MPPSARATSPRTRCRLGALTLDRRRHLVDVGGARVDLGPAEYRLLEALATTPGQVLTRKELIERIWGQANAAQSLALERQVAILSHKLRAAGSGSPTIVPVRLQAYRLLPADQVEPAERLAS